MKQTIDEQLPLPQGVTLTCDGTTITVKGPQGELKRAFIIPRVTVSSTNNTFVIKTEKATKREKKQMYTTLAHVKNMIHGVQKPYTYLLKICSGHFPMNVSIANNNFIVKNFLGEKFPRTMPLKQGVTITIQGDKITVTSLDKELAGQTASDIELLTKISNRDPRVFQDGIHLIEKAGEPIA